MVADPDLVDEQQFLDLALDGLEAMKGEAARMLESVLDLGRGGTFQSRTERDIVVRTSLARLSQLEIGDQALCFGRIDRVPDEPGQPGESFHIGRLAVSSRDHEPLVVDWRAPVAEPFYRATGLDPQGLARRRHLAVKGRTVVGVEDEYFAQPTGAPGGALVDGPATNGTAPAGGLADEALALGGPGALLAALGQARTGQMSDIVGTIQREQDEIIRSPLAGVLAVQGGPGTGKTAVALHRAAYLLYTHRFPLERQGVLVVGPNPLFLRYIEQVLPSLGETGVTLSTVSGLVPEVRARAPESVEVARLKGDVKMARVLARAVRTRQRPLREDVALPFGATTLRLSVADSVEIVAAARRRPGTHNARRRFVEQRVVARLADQYERFARGITNGTVEADDEPAESGTERAELGRRLRRDRTVAELLHRIWPRLAPHELLHDLFGARPLLAAAGNKILTAHEQTLLFRPRAASLDAVTWTVADAALIDEARTILGPRRVRAARARSAGREQPERGDEGGFWPVGLDPNPVPSGNGSHAGVDDETIRSYGHIVIDEVQDLSAMQLRMLARRSLSGSMTVVGDIAQATGPWAARDWDEITTHLSPKREPRLVELTVSYRTPAEVVELAAGVLAVAAPGVTPPRPVRRSGTEPSIVQAQPGALGARVAEVVGSELAVIEAGRLAVLVPPALRAEIASALAGRGLEAVDPRDPQSEGLGAPLVLLPADVTNGLEFDSVVVVEPALIVADDDGTAVGAEGPPVAIARGLRTLYVALTRPTRRLTVVHARPLPLGLASP